MGAEPNPKTILSFQEYVKWELDQEERHEYYDGEVFAMAGGTEDHDLVAGNVFAELRQHLRGKGCRGLYLEHEGADPAQACRSWVLP